MADLDDVARFVGRNHGLAVVSLVRGGDVATPQGSLINAGVCEHPVSGDRVVGFVTRGSAYKARRLRTHPHAALTWIDGWEWIGVEGGTELFGPDDPLDGADVASLPQVLRDVFRGAGGAHDDWDTYDRVMREERRTAVFVRPTRFLGR